MFKEFFKKSLFLKQIVRNYRLKTRVPDWTTLIEKDLSLWKDCLNNCLAGQKILIPTSVGSHLPRVIVEGLLAVALTLRKKQVHILLCDKKLPACLDCVKNYTLSEEEMALYGPSRKLCKNCFKYAFKMYSYLGIKVHKYSDFLSQKDLDFAKNLSLEVPIDKVGEYVFRGFKVGEHALAGALRFYARGELENEKHVEMVLKRYFKASIITAIVIEKLLKAYNFNVAVFHHGIYIPQGVIGEVCRKNKVRVVNWNPAYRKKCFIFSHGDTYHHTLMNEPVGKWENLNFNNEKKREILSYLRSRWYGTNDWIWFHEKPYFSVAKIERRLGMSFDQPTIGMLTNVVWDAQLHYPANIFPNMIVWVLKTIKYFSQRKDLQLVIRVHPAEIRGTVPSRQLIADEIRKVFPVLPKNVFVVKPSEKISTYPLMEKCNAVIIYGTKTGVELTSMGIPVIVAGEAWIKNKNITFDPKTQNEYFKILNSLPFRKRMTEEQKNRALKYAYHFFFRRMIPLTILNTVNKYPPYEIGAVDLNDLIPGKDRGLDVICQGIIQGDAFIYND